MPTCRPNAITRGASTMLLALAMITGLLFLGATPALAATNDYPYRSQTNTSTVDPWGFTERQCTSFAAWRSHQRGHDMHSTTATPWGNASYWDQEAVALGVAVNATPTVGSFAQWHAGEKRTWTSGSSSYWFAADTDGHVAYVAAVYTDGTVLLQDYNGFGGSRTYGTKRLPRSGVPRYIHLAG
jgi:surface antigen